MNYTSVDQSKESESNPTINQDANEVDAEFVAKIEKCTAFSLNSSYFTSLKYKKEIQFLFSKHWFVGFDGHINGPLTAENLSNAVQELKRISSEDFDKLFNYTMSGIGPGEILLYYVYNHATLGGNSSSGVDLIIGSQKYEVKAVKTQKGKNDYSDTTFAYDFKLGGTINIQSVLKSFGDLAKTHGQFSSGKMEIPNGKMSLVREADEAEYEKIQDEFRDITKPYFGSHSFIFLSNSTKDLGLPVYVGDVDEKMVYMDRFTSSTLKPMIALIW
jgi:hypothetical protein